ncbi:MAG TPA: ADP-ribosylglycohydrolase family protein, partial [Phycisphaerae bacterium]|nr:ADP-ribosylglycohydrolase family protein [Phycisphaerae bacterium]
SFGNGSAMRVSPVAHAFETEQEVLDEAARTAECTHNHPEGVKGAQATALAVFLARIGRDKEAIRKAVQDRLVVPHDVGRE